MRQTILILIVIASTFNLTGCGDGAPNIAQIGQAVSQIAGLVGKIQGNNGVRNSNVSKKVPQRLAQQNQVMPNQNSKVLSDNTETVSPTPAMSPQVSLNANNELTTSSISTKESEDQDFKNKNFDTSENFADEPLIANLM